MKILLEHATRASISSFSDFDLNVNSINVNNKLVLIVWEALDACFTQQMFDGGEGFKGPWFPVFSESPALDELLYRQFCMGAHDSGISLHGVSD